MAVALGLGRVVGPDDERGGYAGFGRGVELGDHVGEEQYLANEQAHVGGHAGA